MLNVGAGRYRRSLTSTARRLVAAEWPVVPGAWWSPIDGRYRCDLSNCMTTTIHPAPIGCHEGALCAPGWTDLARYAVTTVNQATQRWAHRPYTVLLVTGVVVDVIDAPPHIADALLHHLHLTGRSVVAARVADRVLLLLATGPSIEPERAANWSRAGVLFHQRGSWIVLPPSVINGVRTRWLRHPSRRDPVPPAPTRGGVVAAGPNLPASAASRTGSGLYDTAPVSSSPPRRQQVRTAMTARRYTPDQLSQARSIQARHIPVADGRTCAACGWPYPCPECSRSAFVLSEAGGRR